MCVAHIYGVVLYFGTEYRNEKLTGDSASLPDFLFYWVYYVGFNIVWAFVPACKSLKPGFKLGTHTPESNHLTGLGQGYFGIVGWLSLGRFPSVRRIPALRKTDEAARDICGDVLSHRLK